MARQGVDFVAANQDFQAAGGADVGLQRAHDGIDRHLLAENPGGHAAAQGLGEIGHGRAVGKQIELEKDGVGGQSALDGAGRTGATITLSRAMARSSTPWMKKSLLFTPGLRIRTIPKG